MAKKIGLGNNRLDYRYYLSMIPKPVREKGKNFAPIIGAFLLIIFFLFTAIKPTASEIAQLLAEIKARKELNARLQTKIKQLVAAQNYYNQIYDKIYLLDEALPTDAQFASLAKRIEAERISQKLALTGLNYSNISLTEENGAESVSQENSFSFSGSLTGEYTNFKSFLDELFYHRRPVYVKSFQVSKPQKNNKNEEEVNINDKALQVDLVGQVFYFSNAQK